MKIANHAYREEGEGTPIVLLHAFPVDHRMWDECARLLIDRADRAGMEPFPVYAPDMPGAGDSPVPSAQESGPTDPDGAYSQALDRMSEAYADLLTSLGHREAIWVGLSMGGYLAEALVRLRPQMVAGLALCDTTADADKPSSRANRLHVAAQAEREGNVHAVMSFAQSGPGDSTIKRSPEYTARFTGWVQDQSPEGIAWRQRMAAGRPDQRAILSQVRVPAAVVCGELDPSSPPSSMQAIVDTLRPADPSFTAIADCGHFSAAERPDRVADALLALARRVADRRANH
ncbi:alpha/beta hydrolase [Bifidobacterium actinocoloniiforme DSM 22766]|uniref:Alpha/beta hydrolase n=1 Tax=Bifidobacterium actinocoloniiforme DSM 22766 TaxID=1437605 RepID=A0A086YZD3_9BIFI|nr:alpha/beta hydrolase [Bifidobacterium actinocoloniiforme]AKV54975.1 alpha/beta hydrolase [Bifidobacterium actinocoloniiforme DSM 22766]KFI39633.1 alpha/beta hydrolase [Bifidobacterium actinocoloniiforme DSM 22766]